MRPLSALFMAACTATVLSAQSNCSTAATAGSLATRSPFAGGSVYGHPNFPAAPGPTYTGFTFLMDLTIAAPIDITQIDCLLYDDGGAVDLGNGMTVTMPNQLGATTNVELYILPVQSWMGQETNQGVWGLAATGTLTVASRALPSIAVLNTPLTLTPGLWGIAFKVDQTTTGPAPGPLHPLLDPSGTVIPSYSNADLQIDNLVFQRESWTATNAPVAHEQNLEIHYTRSAGAANWTTFGTGCVAPNDPQLSLLTRPVVGTAVDLETVNIPAGAQFSFWFLSFFPDANGLDLTGFGLPGCSLYMQINSLVPSLTGVGGGVSAFSLPIPNSPAYSGIVMYAQSAPLTPGVNAAGVSVSNAACIAIGQF